MNDERTPPLDADDPEMDRLLASLARPLPPTGFEDLVLGRVQIPWPHWAIAIRDALRGWTTGRRGWIALATLSTVTAVVWGSAIAVAVWNAVPIGALYQTTVAHRVEAAWGAAWALAASAAHTATARVPELVTIAGLHLGTLVAMYGAVCLVSALALLRLTAIPTHLKGTSHVAR